MRVRSHIDLEPHLILLMKHASHRKVKAVVARESGLSQALFEIAAGQRHYWDLISWAALTERLDSCDLTVEQWIDQRKGT